MAVSVPVFTVTPKSDNVSIDLILAALPSGADQVNFYKRTATGYDSLIGTLTGPGALNDNGGSGYSKYKVVHYIAIGEDTVGSEFSLPSFDMIGQVGVLNKFTMSAFLAAIRDILTNDSFIITKKYNVDSKNIPADIVARARKREIVVLPDEELPDNRYATSRVENQLPVRIMIMTKHGSSTCWDKNDEIVERVLELLAINYRWEEKVYNTAIGTVNRRDTVEGAQGQYAVASIPLISFGQYAKFL